MSDTIAKMSALKVVAICITVIVVLSIITFSLFPQIRDLFSGQADLTQTFRNYTLKITGSSKLILAETQTNQEWTKSVDVTHWKLSAHVDATITAQVKYYYYIDIDSPLFSITRDGSVVTVTSPYPLPLDPAIDTSTIRVDVNKSILVFVSEDWFRQQMILGFFSTCKERGLSQQSLELILPSAEKSLRDRVAKISSIVDFGIIKTNAHVSRIDVEWK